MVVEITSKENKYYWSVYDGPDGCELYDGVAETLGECFEEIVKSRLLIAQKYQ